jgi:hypothetical protein
LNLDISLGEGIKFSKIFQVQYFPILKPYIHMSACAICDNAWAFLVLNPYVRTQFAHGKWRKGKLKKLGFYQDFGNWA